MSLRHGKRYLLVFCLLVSGLALPQTAKSADHFVSDCGDTNSPGQLRYIIKNQAQGGDTIKFSPRCDGTPILLTGPVGEDANEGGDIDISDKDLTFEGNGPAKTVIDGQFKDRVFDIKNTLTTDIHITFRNLTLQKGYFNLLSSSFPFPDEFYHGGGIYWKGRGRLILENTKIFFNFSKKLGGGVYFEGGRTGSVIIAGSALGTQEAGNTAVKGGGIFIESGVIEIDSSLLAGNKARDSGGALFNKGGMVSLTNSTLSGNIADRDGGGIYTDEFGEIHLNNATITKNTADADNDAAGTGGGVKAFYTGKINLRNTLLAGNFKADPSKVSDCSGRLTTFGFNLIGLVDQVDCELNNYNKSTTRDLWSSDATKPVDPLLGPLEDHGGPTKTIMPFAASPAVDAGNNAGCTDENGNFLITDQRGGAFPRPGGPSCDIGAVEIQPCPPPEDSCQGDGQRDPTSPEFCYYPPKPDGSICNDGNACSEGETCQSGVCQAAATLTCNDGNSCTDDICDPSVGCLHANNNASCEDGNACTQNDACFEGSCLGSPLSVDDSNVCTADSCDREKGVVHTPIAACCAQDSECRERESPVPMPMPVPTPVPPPVPPPVPIPVSEKECGPDCAPPPEERGTVAGSIDPEGPEDPDPNPDQNPNPAVYVCRAGDSNAFDLETGEIWIDLSRPCDRMTLEEALSGFHVHLASTVEEFLQGRSPRVLKEKVQPAIADVLAQTLEGKMNYPIYGITLPAGGQTNAAPAETNGLVKSAAAGSAESTLLVVVDRLEMQGGGGKLFAGLFGCSLVQGSAFGSGIPWSWPLVLPVLLLGLLRRREHKKIWR